MLEREPRLNELTDKLEVPGANLLYIFDNELVHESTRDSNAR